MLRALKTTACKGRREVEIGPKKRLKSGNRENLIRNTDKTKIQATEMTELGPTKQMFTS